MQQQLRRVDVARKEFIATASHELRTPIFSLGGFVELLQDEELDEETRREFLDTMSEQVERLQKLSVNLLDLSRLDSGSVELQTEPVDLAELTRSIADEFHPRLAEHGTELHLQVPEEGPSANCDRRTGGSDRAYPARQRPPPHAGGHGRHREGTPRQRRRRAHGGRQGPRPPGGARSRCSSASTPATPPAAPASGWRSPASWRSGWTGACCSTPSAVAPCSRSSCPSDGISDVREGGGRWRSPPRRCSGRRLRLERRRAAAGAAAQTAAR